MRRGVAARRRRKQHALGVLLISIVIVIFLVLGGWFLLSISNEQPVDEQTGCLQRGFVTVTAVLVDTTDALTPVQGAALKNLLAKLKADTPKYGRLEIYALQPITTNPLAPIFAGCNPGSAADVPSPLTGNPKLAQRRWNQEFGEKVDNTLQRLHDMQPQETSPIFEAMQSIAVTAFQTEQAQSAKAKDLYIVSDFIQYVPQMNMYKGVPDYGAFQNTQYYRQIRAKLYGVSVYMYWIPRPTHRDVQTAQFRDFWREYIRDVGGNSKEWTSLQ